jgi:hypothetical protein
VADDGEPIWGQEIWIGYGAPKPRLPLWPSDDPDPIFTAPSSEIDDAINAAQRLIMDFAR